MIAIRELVQHAEFVEAVKLQKIIWGFDDIDLLPVRMFVVASKIGGQVLGAFDDQLDHQAPPVMAGSLDTGADSDPQAPALNRDRLPVPGQGADRHSPAELTMVGFCISLPALKPSGPSYLHSHMLGVLDQYRNAGIGRALKLEQRRIALARGIALVEWTFDPLEIKNAHFNIERLGAIATRYVVNQYGVTTSRLQAGLPTDRCTAEWWIASQRVESVLSGLEPARPPIAARISVPADIDTIKRVDPMRAWEIQSRVSAEFQEHFSNDLAVVGFEQTGDSAAYLLAPYKAADNAYDTRPESASR